MIRSRIALVAALAGLLTAAMPASAELARPQAGVHGGGFIKGLDKSKTTLTISAFDDLVLGDKGQAQLVRHTPGGKAHPVHVTLQCVNVFGSTAVAAGFGTDGAMYLIVVQDNGQGQSIPDAFAVVQALGAPIYCIGGIVPADARLGPIQGGNFQVTNGT